MRARHWMSAACLFIASAAQADETQRFYGYAFDAKGERYVYTEVHEQRYEQGRWIGGRVRYFAPDGSAIGEMALSFGAQPYIPIYRLEQRAPRYSEGVTAADEKQLTVSKRRGDAAAKTKQLALQKGMAAGPGFHPLLVSKAAALKAGDTVPFVFVAPGNLDSYRFRARRSGEAEFEGRKAMLITLELDSALRLVAPSLRLTYDPDTMKLLEYRGPSNLIDPATDKVYDVRVSYFSQPPKGAPSQLPPLQP